ncbi:Uncharacterized protein APZ42_032370 [Daphnia magna]|uniref:Reverse transcriptase domain-containing protein n=1 Tax=Daphnia magna TaxID=35525 RepID=A0A162D9I9_9CRUS|nr:Uncharacterized protein APZ42_032370 [Daphnia magna]
MKKILKMAYLEGISIREARYRQTTLYSSIARRTNNPPAGQGAPTTAETPEMAALANQVKRLQEEIKVIRESTIPQIQGDIRIMVEDLAETKEKIKNFDTRFDKLEGAQADLAIQQESRFDRLELLMNNLCGELNRQTTRSTPYQTNQRQMTTSTDPLRNPITLRTPNPESQLLSPMFEPIKEWNEMMDGTDYEDVLLSETHWNSAYNVKFRTYHTLKKDRPNRMGGGVAILVHKSLQFTPLILNNTDTIEAIGVKIKCTNNKTITFTSVYIPQGDCEVEDVEALITNPDAFVTGGDFNGHHGMWETNTRENKAGRSIHEALLNTHAACLITPKNMGTRIDPTKGKESTLDLTITSPEIANTANITLGPHLGSDHLPITIILNAALNRSSGRPPGWRLDERKWTEWNENLDASLKNKCFHQITNPEKAMEEFTESLEEANKKNFKKTGLIKPTNAEPDRPWWNTNCKNLVQTAREAYNKWKKAPLSPGKRDEWKKAEARKKKGIITAKREAWKVFITKLGSRDQPKMCSFVNCMLGKGINLSPDATEIRNNEVPINDPKEKAELFLEIFSKSYTTGVQHKNLYEELINARMAINLPNTLNDRITSEEQERALPKSKIKAMGPDLIHNEMIRNLSSPNKLHLLHLFNGLLTNAHVPSLWKQSIVIPLLKPGKPRENPTSYRPVSLTSCLSKTMERIIANRLHWFLETKGKINKIQAGFRRGCSTMDHIIQLETDIVTSFSQKKSTVAVFLDIEKAYDSIWIQGLLFKMASMGITGAILAWLKNFVTGRSMSVRIGDQESSHKSISNGVPQGAVISPILFNIMMNHKCEPKKYKISYSSNQDNIKIKNLRPISQTNSTQQNQQPCNREAT